VAFVVIDNTSVMHLLVFLCRVTTPILIAGNFYQSQSYGTLIVLYFLLLSYLRQYVVKFQAQQSERDDICSFGGVRFTLNSPSCITTFATLPRLLSTSLRRVLCQRLPHTAPLQQCRICLPRMDVWLTCRRTIEYHFSISVAPRIPLRCDILRVGRGVRVE